MSALDLADLAAPLEEVVGHPVHLGKLSARHDRASPRRGNPMAGSGAVLLRDPDQDPAVNRPGKEHRHQRSVSPEAHQDESNDDKRPVGPP